MLSSFESESRTIPERILVSTGVNLSSLERAASFILGAWFGLVAVRVARVKSRRAVVNLPAEMVKRAAFGWASFALVRRAAKGHSRLSSALGLATRDEEFVGLRSSSARLVREPQRTVTILASVEEIELFLLDPPRLGGYEIGRDLDLQFAFHPGPRSGETELQARLIRWPAELGRADADRILRDVLREAKQFIETGEVAMSDARIHGPRSRRAARTTEAGT